MSARPLFLVYAGVSYELDRADLVLPRTYWGNPPGFSLGKSLDLHGFVDVLLTYRRFSDRVLWPVALTIVGIEWILAVWIFGGRDCRSGHFLP